MSLIEQRIANHLANGGTGFYIKGDAYTMDVRGKGDRWSVSIWKNGNAIHLNALHNRNMTIGQVAKFFAQSSYSGLEVRTY